MRGEILAATGAIVGGLGLVMGAELLKRADPLLVTAMTSLLAGVVLLAFSDKEELRKLLQMKKELIELIALRGVLLGAMFNMSLSLIPAVHALFLTRLEPVLVAVFAFLLLKQDIGKRGWLLIAMTLIGGFLFITGGGTNELLGVRLLGDALMIGAVTASAYSYLLVKKAATEAGGVSLAAMIFTFAGIILLPVWAITAPLETGSVLLETNNLLLFCGYTLLFSVLGLALFYKSFESIDAWKASALLALSPVTGGVLAWLWLGETLAPIQVAGAAVILITSYMITISR
ncbi:MAG: DMT family transporter [Candidatus Diapherotrites archaeon]|nr:DMT family transporter [Candidatus Diapherotrites archaeon]